MFHWYRSAKICFAYLSDLGFHHELDNCRWFTRGWTLQEVIAPSQVEFYNNTWTMIGTKESLRNQLHCITKIDKEVLQDSHAMKSISVAKKMTWAASRQTTRIEDMAYCLLGIFDVNMPLLYGEREKAFRRLQEEIVKSTHDMTVFSWRRQDAQLYSGVFAKSPREFVVFPGVGNVSRLLDDSQGEFSVTNRRVKILSGLIVRKLDGTMEDLYILPIGWADNEASSSDDEEIVCSGIFLAQYGGNSFVRTKPDAIEMITTQDSYMTDERVIYALSDMNGHQSGSIETLRSSAIQFFFNNFDINVHKATQDSLWNRDRKVLFIPSTGKGWTALNVDIHFNRHPALGPRVAGQPAYLLLLFFFPSSGPIISYQEFENPHWRQNSLQDMELKLDICRSQRLRRFEPPIRPSVEVGQGRSMSLGKHGNAESFLHIRLGDSLVVDGTAGPSPSFELFLDLDY